MTDRRDFLRTPVLGLVSSALVPGGAAALRAPSSAGPFDGVDVLRAGGNACDAALAASISQTFVEPHMTTITGMLSLLHHDAASGTTHLVPRRGADSPVDCLR